MISKAAEKGETTATATAKVADKGKRTATTTAKPAFQCSPADSEGRLKDSEPGQTYICICRPRGDIIEELDLDDSDEKTKSSKPADGKESAFVNALPLHFRSISGSSRRRA